MKNSKIVEIEIEAKFGSKFQEQFARDSLMSFLKNWQDFLLGSNAKNDVIIVINGDSINHLDHFNFEKKYNK